MDYNGKVKFADTGLAKEVERIFCKIS
ncbi:unnamed protein product [Victoria cruziana]